MVADWTPLDVPHAVTRVDRIPAARYHDPEFFAMEAELLWPRVWQMACRLEEIPDAFDVVEYEILDQSVIVVRGEDGAVGAFHNACRHRGVRLVETRGSCRDGFVCPFHGWCYGPDGANTHVPMSSSFDAGNLVPEDLALTPVRCEVWGGCVWINLDDDAPPLRDCIEPAASILDAWQIESMRAEWWYSFRLPVNWKLAQEAFQEQYHVVQTHPRLVIPGRFPPRRGDFDPAVFIESELHYLRVMSEGMAGMVHANDVAVAERLAATIDLPADAATAMATWHERLNDDVTRWHRERGSTMPDLNGLEAAGRNEPMGYCFPHWFVLPMYSSASSYRFRPLGPEETLMEIWSLTRYPDGESPPSPPRPEPWAHDDPRIPPIPTEDFANLPRQQRGLHARGFDYMRLSAQAEGHISNLHRVIDGYLAGHSHEQLLPALREVNVNPLERPVVPLAF